MATLLNAEANRISNYEIPTCYNASDCIGEEIQYCNHDFDTWGFCSTCSNLYHYCRDQEFIYDRGLLSCNETCGGMLFNMVWYNMLDNIESIIYIYNYKYK